MRNIKQDFIKWKDSLECVKDITLKNKYKGSDIIISKEEGCYYLNKRFFTGILRPVIISYDCERFLNYMDEIEEKDLDSIMEFKEKEIICYNKTKGLDVLEKGTISLK